MKIRLSKDSSPPSYLTRGKEYEFSPIKEGARTFGTITLDGSPGEILIILGGFCSHAGGYWEVVNES